MSPGLLPLYRRESCVVHNISKKSVSIIEQKRVMSLEIFLAIFPPENWFWKSGTEKILMKMFFLDNANVSDVYHMYISVKTTVDV